MSNISTKQEDRVFHIEFNRPEKKNAITLQMYRDMTEAFREAEKDDNVRVIMLSGKECFTSGNDIKDFLQSPPSEADRPGLVFLETISQAKKPVVAAAHNMAIGIGTTLLLHCDLVYAAEKTMFHLPFVNLGICPEAASSLIIQQLVGYHKAAEIFFFGDPFDAQAAKQIGFVNEVFQEDELFSKVLDKVQNLAQKPPTALRTTKELLKNVYRSKIQEIMQQEIQEFIKLLQGPEAKEAMTAFMERRKPNFSKF